MDEQKVNEKLFEYCKETLDSIKERELLTKKPKQFIDHTDAAACNRQYDLDFDQEKVIKMAILKWGRKVLQHLAINSPVKLKELLGLYIDIHVEIPFNTKEMPPMKYAMLEVTDLFEKGILTLPLATRLLIAGLQNIIYQQAFQNDNEIQLLFVSLSNATSGITLPYSKALVPITL